MSSTKEIASEIQYIKGIGPKRAILLSKYKINNFADLINFFPRRYIDRSNIFKLNELKPEQEVTVIGKIIATGIRYGRRKVFYIMISDDNGFLEGIWFQSVDYFKNLFKVGDWVSLSGKVGFYRGYQLIHPDYDRLDSGEIDNLYNTGRIIPFYPENEHWKRAGINSQFFRKIFPGVKDKITGTISEYFPDSILQRRNLPERSSAYIQIHMPDDEVLLDRSINRFKYEDFFYHQFLFALQKYHNNSDEQGISFEKTSGRLEKLYQNLPFTMTAAQKKVVKEIRADMKQPTPMNRLLQGDVGAGKTLVALMAILIAIDNGYQAVMMAPTEILAEQHYFNIKNTIADLDVTVCLLTGSSTEAERNKVKRIISSREPALIIGTHALIQKSVRFSRLGLVVIDEQHRFGVMQRASLIQKGITPDTLVMTATPIPRTLAMTVYGSLDVSVIDELPPNRKKITTLWRFEDKAMEIYNLIKEKVNKGQQAFIVYPLVEESEKLDLKAAVDGYSKLSKGIFKDYKPGLLHGRMKANEKEQIMNLFVSNKIHILISTTVIEVGVDIPNATIMVIEHAERFGLSQLHQMRGRVGRGTEQSYCILKTPFNIGDTAKERMKIMTETQDGFVIAEKDLLLRGWGDFFGTKQSGMPEFRIANPIADRQILEEAREDAFQIVQKDPFLRLEENKKLNQFVQTHLKERINLYKIS
ncbi:MAG: ATP-dependent DNA helicase RecG [Calditrichaceae bacterium]|nr:ATP-dependent DNA helicase RecG [Calditrichaceae bacterium]MBN2709196.1 ATP-dependent DNA helicase RecG [Calditrichaceae bacterium]RQV96152.1 MAG: ATP-dependent DNA helicase RecG [Calditrichota bacterium]